MNVSYYRHVGDKEGAVVNFRKILTNIAQQRFDQDVSLIRTTESQAKKDAFKKGLPCFTPAGVFADGQTIDGCTEYNYLIVLDIDPDIPVAKGKKVPQEGTLEDWVAAAQNDPFTYAAFISPSGNGVKVFVKLEEGSGVWDNFKDFHYDAFQGLAAHYMDNYNIVLDRSGKNINRLCFVSSDSNLYINNSSETFKVVKVERVTEFTKEYTGYESDDLIGTMNVAIKCVERSQHFVDSNRNNYVYELSCTLNRFGVSYEDTLHLIGQFFELPGFPDPKSEWVKTIESAYKHHREEFGRVTPIIPDDAIKAPEMKMGEETDYYNVAKELFEKLKDMKLAKKLLIAHYAHRRREGSEMRKERAIFILKKAYEEGLVGAGLENLDSKIEYIMNVVGNDKIPSVIPQFSDEMRGGYTPGKVVGLIGTEGSYKTWLAMNEAVNSAKLGYDTAYFNLEMSDYQFLTRMGLIVLHRDLDMEITTMKNSLAVMLKGAAFKEEFSKRTRELVMEFYRLIDEATNKKLKIFSKQGLSETEIGKLFQRHAVDSGNNIRLAVVDGIWGLEQKFNDEIKSAMSSAKALKELANETNSTLLVLSHSKTGVLKHTRNQHDFVLGGRKILSNIDSFISMSLCVNPAETNWDTADYSYRKGIIYMRMFDRRDGLIGEVDVIAKTSPYVEFEATYDNPKDYEARKPTGNGGVGKGPIGTEHSVKGRRF